MELFKYFTFLSYEIIHKQFFSEIITKVWTMSMNLMKNGVEIIIEKLSLASANLAKRE